MEARLLFVHALSPLHAGTGQGVGVIDLPIAREKATNLPFLPGSSIKGTLRDLCAPPHRDRVFGPEAGANAGDYAGSAQFADARLLLLPVRSLAGTFAWVTSPYILQRLQRDAQNTSGPIVPATVPQPVNAESCLVVEGCKVTLPNTTSAYLEDLDLQAVLSPEAAIWAQWLAAQVFPGDNAWQRMLSERFCIVHDDVMSFLLQTATEITARIKLLDDQKTVQQGGLWYEESLPCETILSGLIVATPVRGNGAALTPADIFEAIGGTLKKPTQLGGKATVGRGLCRLQMLSTELAGNPAVANPEAANENP